ncbi:MAG: hypothetical protein HYX94_03950, partial [Chloroflexi bacterium]|nr:hypothetical protein [Chloroflexota bacterium]
MGWLYQYQFGDRYVKQSDFRYEMQTNITSPVHSSLNTLDKPSNYWGSSAIPGGAYSRVWTAKGSFDLSSAGLNFRPNLYLAEGHAIGVQECWVGNCYLEPEQATLHIDVGDMFVVDIFPPTLDDFYSLTSRGNSSSSLAWDQRFPVQCDADGDGARSKACGGNDPDDSQADTDGDGVSDLRELQLGTDPVSPGGDGDGDGLTDLQELEYGTNPWLADSDGDGLIDCEEVVHPVLMQDRYGRCGEVGAWYDGWWFTYGLDSSGQPLRTKVVSNPRNAMTADDGMLDSQKKALGLNPRIPNDGNIMRVSATNSAYGSADMFYVGPGQSFAYTETVQNSLIDRLASGLAEVDFPAVASPTGLAPTAFNLIPRQTITTTGAIAVSADITATQQLSLTNRAGASVVNNSTVGDKRTLRLRFEEAANAATFADASLHGDVTCTANCPTAGAAGFSGKGVRFDSSRRQYLDLGTATALGLNNSSFTVMLWVNGSGLASTGGDVPLLGIEGSDANKALHLTVRNGKPYMGFYGNDTAGATSLSANQWYHLAFRYDKDKTEQAIFVNGVKDVARTGHAAMQGTGHVRLGTWYSRYFGGVMDELEIYPTALDDDEIAAKLTDPVLHLGFDGSWGDSSPFGNVVTPYKGSSVSTTAGPALVAGVGIAGGAASFAGNKYAVDGGKTLKVTASQSLDLSGGDFSQTFWIAPTKVAATDNEWNEPLFGLVAQGVLGADGPPSSTITSEYAYPFVQVVGTSAQDSYWSNERRIRAGYSEQCSGQTDRILPADGQWRHVAVTYDSSAKLHKVYLDGVERGYIQLPSSCASPSPLDASKPILIGRSRAPFGDPSKGRSVGNQRQTWTTGVPRVPDTANIDGGYYHSADWDFHSVRLKNTCVTLYSDFSYKGTSQEFCRDTEDYFDLPPAWGDWGKVKSLALTPLVLPFDGKLDDVRIYRRALSADEVQSLAAAAGNKQYLAFDEPPGATTFADGAGSGLSATCSAGFCPISGLPGAINRAAHFDGVGQHVQSNLATAATDNVTLNAAVYWEGPTSGDQVVVYNGDPSANGYGIVVKPDGKLAIKSGPGGTATSSAILVANRWRYISAVREDGVWKMYYNAIPTTLAGNPAVTAPVAANKTYVGSEGTDSYFRGMIDEVGIAERAWSRERIATLVSKAPKVNLHFDDLPGTTSFKDSAGEYSLACTAGACPQAGAKGRVRDAVIFDGQNDKLSTGTAPSIPSGQFSVSVWVKPASVPNGVKTLVSYGGGYSLGIVGSAGIPYARFVAQIDPWHLPDGFTGTTPLVVNAWNHVVVTSDGSRVRLYVAGVPEASASRPTISVSSQLEIGGRSGETSGFFHGQLDEVQIWDHALTANEVQKLFQVQNFWFDSAIRSAFTVDAEKPVAALDVSFPYVNTRDVVMCFSPRDASSGVATAQYNSGDGWKDATPDGETWCFTHSSPLVGPRNLSVRARDMVGNWSDPAPAQIYVDVDPPNFWVDQSLTENILDGGDGRVTLSGQAADNASGVDYLTVDLVNQVGVSAHRAVSSTVAADGTWQAIYPFPYPPNGSYVVKLQGVDKAGNATTRTGQSVRIDGTGPAALLTYTGVSTRTIGGIGASLPTISGTVTEAPDPGTSVSSGVSKVEVGLLHARDKDHPERADWREATLDSPGQATANWRYPFPEGLEGPYRIDLRATDGLGNVKVSPNQWSGDVDTVAPRVQITATVEGGKIRYVTAVQDFNLSQQGFSSFCGAGVVNTATNFAESWYTSLIQPLPTADRARASSRLYGQSASCLVDRPPTISEEGAVNTGEPSGVALSGSYAYISDYRNKRLRAIDISNPAMPVEVGSFGLPSTARPQGVVISGTYAYVSDNKDGLRIVDISNPRSPVGVGAYRAADLNASATVISGTYAFVVHASGGLQSIDIANPASPKFAGSVKLQTIPRSVAVSGNYVYVAGSSGLYVIDVTNPRSPVRRGYLNMSGWILDVAASGGYAYVANFASGLRVIDVSNPASPQGIAVLATSKPASSVVVSGTHAYVGVGRGLSVVDVSFPSAPIEVLAYDLPGVTSGLAVSADRAYLAGSSGLQVVNMARSAAEKPLLKKRWGIASAFWHYVGGNSRSGKQFRPPSGDRIRGSL